MITAFALLLWLGLTLPAQAQEPDPVDPESGTPSGFTYSIPLEEARQDAAPNGSGAGDRAPVHADGGSGFGSSPDVPGATPTPGPGGDDGAGATPTPGQEGDDSSVPTAGGSRPGDSGSANGRDDARPGGDDARPGGAGAESDAPVQAASVSAPGGSDSALMPLGILVLALAIGAVFAGLALRRRRA